jgi:hypothetical protein
MPDPFLLGEWRVENVEWKIDNRKKPQASFHFLFSIFHSPLKKVFSDEEILAI